MIEAVTDFQFCTTIAGSASQEELNAAMAEVHAMYEGWCESDIDNDGICDVDEGTSDNNAIVNEIYQHMGAPAGSYTCEMLIDLFAGASSSENPCMLSTGIFYNWVPSSVAGSILGDICPATCDDLGFAVLVDDNALIDEMYQDAGAPAGSYTCETLINDLEMYSTGEDPCMMPFSENSTIGDICQRTCYFW